MSFLSSHWKKLLGLAVGVVGAFTPLGLPVVALGGIILGTDFQVGASAGTPIGRSAKIAQGRL